MKDLMRQDDLEALVAELDRVAHKSVPSEQRPEKRYDYRYSVTVNLLGHTGSVPPVYEVQARNLSENGVGFLHHRSSMTLGSECTVSLRTPNGGILQADGMVARCRQINDRVQEVGVRFCQPIPLNLFVYGNVPDSAS